MKTNQPQAGFATTADTAPMNDGYEMYNQAVTGVDQVFDALQTEAGRQAVGA